MDGTETQLVSLNSRRESDGVSRAKMSNGDSRNHTINDDHFERLSTLSHSQSHVELKSSLKYFDANGGDRDGGGANRKQANELRPLTVADRNLSSVSISKTVEFIDSNGRGLTGERDCTIRIEHEVDSAVEESTSSTDNNQVNLGVISGPHFSH